MKTTVLETFSKIVGSCIYLFNTTMQDFQIPLCLNLVACINGARSCLLKHPAPCSYRGPVGCCRIHGAN